MICEFVSGRKVGRKEGMKVSSASQTNKKASHIKLVLQQQKKGVVCHVCVCVRVCVCLKRGVKKGEKRLEIDGEG